MLENDVSRLASIRDAGGTLVVHEEGSFYALFDNDFKAALGDGMIESRGPALTCRLSDVQDLRKGTVLTIGGVTYKLTKQEPEESTGFSMLFLGR